jgi:general secretion pathway protein K
LKPQNGFALAAALWLLAGLAIVVSLVNDTARTSAERVRQLRERTDFVRSSLATRAQVLYFAALATPQANGFGSGGASVIADETPYKADPLSVVRLQDLGGLVNLNSFSRPILERFLEICGVEQTQVPYLVDALEDYIDEDDLQRINGAERDTYSQLNKPSPRNALLLSVDEIWQVHGWSALKKTWSSNGCTHALTISGTGLSSSINLATAPLLVLKAAGVDEASAQDIVSARVDINQLAERTNLANAQSGNSGMFGFGAGAVRGELRVTHEHATLPWVMGYTLKLSLDKDDTPWSFTQPVIGARSNSPVVPSARAAPWPQNTALLPSASDNKSVLPF